VEIVSLWKTIISAKKYGSLPQSLENYFKQKVRKFTTITTALLRGALSNSPL